MASNMLAARVEVLWVKREIIMFDFGNFGIVIDGYKSQWGHRIQAFFESNSCLYSKEFMKIWEAFLQKGICPVQKRLIPQAFEDVQYAFACMDDMSFEYLWKLLSKVFPSCMKKYGG